MLLVSKIRVERFGREGRVLGGEVVGVPGCGVGWPMSQVDKV